MPFSLEDLAMQSDEIREAFLKYFESKGHRILPSSPLIPQNDPTLLFTNAGMVQFKDLFTGREKGGLRRAATSQKCMRAGGKHNDLENVGLTARHHTFFEMLGNFSFGDYFKEEAIAFAWEFITEVVRLDKERLYITIYKDDEEAFNLWQGIAKVDAKRIFRMGEEENFWSMGDTGPCGPCSEIIYDQGEGVGCGRTECTVGCDCDRFLEIWNLVFMQFERSQDGRLSPLPKPSIDTGMGLERLTSVIQNKLSNFDTDLFYEIINAIAELGKVEYHRDESRDSSIRVIADHSRAAAFLISDGVLPSNEGRGYVLRRIIRRAIRHAHLLGIKDIFFYKICDVVVEKMGRHFTELVRNRGLIEKATRHEEERFRETLEKGLTILREEFSRLRSNNIRTLEGTTVFKLYDTYGFPVDLVSIIARENGFEIDTIGFEAEMEHQRERSEWKGSGESEIGRIYKEIKGSEPVVEFSGYERLEDKGRVTAIIKDGQKVDSVEPGREAEITVDRTPFYGESGGQVGDTGLIENEGLLFEVLNTIKVEDLIIHKGIVKKGTLRVGDSVNLRVDSIRRERIKAAHSATHLLHLTLRRILGSHVKQAGSLVEPDRLRFDFSHFNRIEDEMLERIEEEVNRLIFANLSVEIKLSSIKEAMQEGAIALFGEKYKEEVRVVKMGDSIELCGGTHVNATGEIGLFYILRESAVASGVRRIDAVCGLKALEQVCSNRRIIKELERLLSTDEERLIPLVADLRKRAEDLEKKVEMLEERYFASSLNDLLKEAISLKNEDILIADVKAKDIVDLRRRMDMLRNRSPQTILFLYSRIRDKLSLVMSVPKEKTERIDASRIVKDVSQRLGGTGGGRRDMAQGGGSDLTKVDSMKEIVIDILRERLDV